MTNEERIEERLIHAHERGYYEDAMKKIKSMEIYIQRWTDTNYMKWLVMNVKKNG